MEKAARLKEKKLGKALQLEWEASPSPLGVSFLPRCVGACHSKP